MLRRQCPVKPVYSAQFIRLISSDRRQTSFTDVTVSPAKQDKATQIPAWARPEPASDAKVVKLARSALSCRSTSHRSRRYGLKKVVGVYTELSKPRLTALVVLSTMSSYAIAPHALSVGGLAVLTVGTALCSASANSINMARERDYDRNMPRTCFRPVASNRLTREQALRFATLTGAAGVASLWFGTNSTVAALGAFNIILYGGAYTSLKRVSIVNTWVGAAVGAIPPLMGWAACASLADPAPWILAGLLFAWQFPHFMSLSYSIRDEYKNAGYVMSAWTDPLLTARVSLRYSVAMIPLCLSLSYIGVTDMWFCFDSSIVNGWLVYAAYEFWRQQRGIVKGTLILSEENDKKYSRKLFWASVIHLPAILLLAMIHKIGQWDWLSERIEKRKDRLATVA